MVALSGPIIPRLRRSALAGAFLNGVNVASLGLMAAAGVALARVALLDVATTSIALGSILLLARFRVSSSWLVLGGALVGLGLTALGGGTVSFR